MSLRQAHHAVAFLIAIGVAGLGCKSCNKDGGGGTPVADAASDASAVRHARPPVSIDPPRFPVPVQTGCYAAAKAKCNRIGQCGMMHLATHEGLFTNCLSSARDRCLLDHPVTVAAKPESFDACAKAWTASSCDELLGGGDPPAACRPPGVVENGKACIADGQCLSRFCARDAAAACGKCDEAPKEDGDCKQDRCAPGLACHEKKCIKRAPRGEACKGPGGCEANLSCVAGKCVATAKANEKCDPAGVAAPACDVVSAILHCEPTSKTCKPAAPARSTETCGPDAPSRPCAGDMVCKDAKCVRRLSLNDACSADTLPCHAPLFCLDGKCKLPDAAACPN